MNHITLQDVLEIVGLLALLLLVFVLEWRGML